MACARCAAENASLTQMSPSFASSATNAGSFFSSSLWKRVFSRQRMSPSFIAATALAAASPMQSSAKATGFLMTFDSASATGFSESLASRPFGRPKCASRMTLPPLSEISVMVGATRSSRVASVTRPFSMGTLRSTRSSTRLAFTSTSSRVRKDLVMTSPMIPPWAMLASPRLAIRSGLILLPDRKNETRTPTIASNRTMATSLRSWRSPA